MKIRCVIALSVLVLAGANEASAQEVTCTASGGSNCINFIPDFPIVAPYSSTITLAQPLVCTNGSLAAIGVRVDLTHDYVGDLVITMAGPGGTATLLNRPSGSTPFGCAGEDVKATFTAGAAVQACSEASIPAISGNVSVNSNPGALSTAPAGPYTLTVADMSNGMEGFVSDWALVPQCAGLTPQAIPAQSLPGLLATAIALLAIATWAISRRRRRQ